MLKNKPLVVLLILFLFILIADCRCGKRYIVLKSVVLEIPSSAKALSSGIDREKFGTLVEKTIAKSSYFHIDKNASHGFIMRLSMVPSGTDAKNLSLMLMATLTSAGDSADKSYQSFADIKVENGEVAGGSVAKALSQVIEKLYQLFSGTFAHNDEYIDKINATLRGENVDNSELLNAVTILGEAKEQKAVQPLIKLLSTSGDVAVGNACVIALGELKAAEAMEAIIDFAERKPPVFRRQAIIAARRIASKLAAEWLLVMAYGYEDPTVQMEAHEALIEVEGKLGIVDK